MKIAAVILATMLFGPIMCNAQSGQSKTLARFPGTALKWIQIAQPEFERKNLDVTRYNIVVDESADSVYVSLISPDSNPSGRGSTGTYPNFEVTINKKNGKVVSASFAR